MGKNVPRDDGAEEISVQTPDLKKPTNPLTETGLFVCASGNFGS